MGRQLAKRRSFHVSILEVKHDINIGSTGDYQGRCYNEESLVEKGGWIGVYKSADPLKLMAESVDPLKKSTKSESANCFPRWMIREKQSDFNCWSCLAWYCVLAPEDDYQRNIKFINEQRSERWEDPRGWEATFITAITEPSRLSASLLLVIFSIAWHSAHNREKVKFPGEHWDPRSELPNNQNPQCGPKSWMKPRSAVIIGSADPKKFRSESRIRAKIFTKSADP